MATWEEFEPIVKERGLNAIWLRSACKCEYCGVDLLETPQVYRGGRIRPPPTASQVPDAYQYTEQLCYGMRIVP